MAKTKAFRHLSRFILLPSRLVWSHCTGYREDGDCEQTACPLYPFTPFSSKKSELFRSLKRVGSCLHVLSKRVKIDFSEGHRNLHRSGFLIRQPELILWDNHYNPTRQETRYAFPVAYRNASWRCHG